jgi:DNA-binding CsgD family transcriptional regulator
VSGRTAERVELIRALRAEQKTLQEIADAVGVTRERVRQILKQIGGPTAEEVRASTAELRRRSTLEIEQRVRADLMTHPGSTAEDIARRLGMSRSQVQAHVPPDVRPLLVVHAKSSEQTWSEAEIMSALSGAATFAYPLSAGAYEQLLRSGEVRGPSAARIVQRYGNWSNACRRAGVEPTPPRRQHYQSRWTDADMLGFVRDYLTAPGSRGTFYGYDEWRRGSAVGAPSAALLRARLGSWTDMKRKALAS